VLWYAQFSIDCLCGLIFLKGSSVFGLLLLLSHRLFRRLLYEWFLRLHFLLSLAIIIAILFHLSARKSAGMVFAIIGASFWMSMTVVHVFSFGVRNFVWGKPLGQARISNLPNALCIEVTPPRPWKIKAGQYLFLSIPAAGYTQAHPFMIAWWEQGDDEVKIYLLVKPRRGFTNRLAGLSDRRLLAFMDGPYGVDYNFGNHGTVLMFATGIGIAGVVPFIKDLVARSNSWMVHTRRILLIWQLDKESECFKFKNDQCLIQKQFTKIG